MLNDINIQGRFTKDPEMRRTTTGKAVVAFSLAVDRDGEGVDFFDCVAWERTAEHICQHFFKGKAALINGRLQTRSWEDKNGNKRKTVEIVVNRIYFADSKTQQSDANSYPAPPQMLEPLEDEDGHLPF